MLSAIQLSPKTSTVAESQGQVGTATPETGEFDFMSYLLGLQASPTETDELKTAALLQEKTEQEPKADPSATALSALFPTAMQSSFTPVNMESKEATVAELPKEVATYQSDFRESSSDVSDSTQLTAQAGTELGNAHNTGVATKEVALGRYAQNGVFNVNIQGQAEQDTESFSDAEMSSGNHPHLARISDLNDVRRRDNQDSPFSVLSTQLDSPITLTKSEATQALDASPVSKDQAVSVSQMFERVETLASGGGGTMVVTLDPPDLGRVEIQVTARGKSVQVEMTSDNDSTKNLLESQFEDLRSSLQGQDLTLSKLEVRTDREGLNFNMSQFAQSEKQQSQTSEHREFTQQSKENRFSSSRIRQVEMPVVNRALMSAGNASGPGRVDVRI